MRCSCSTGYEGKLGDPLDIEQLAARAPGGEVAGSRRFGALGNVSREVPPPMAAYIQKPSRLVVGGSLNIRAVALLVRASARA